MNYASSRLAPVQPSASAAVSQKAKALKAAGHDVIDLGLGEPDFDTPTHIIEAAYAAAKAGQTRYPPTDGTAELKAAISEKFRRDNQLDYSASEIIVSNGAKQIIFDALMATLEEKQEVLLCAPYFGQYKDMTLILGGVPKVLPSTAENQFRLTPEILKNAITANTRWLILNLPSNPAGAVYTREELAELGQILEQHPQVLIMSDEIYEHIVFDGREFVSFATACPHLKERVLTVNGVSKAYAMTGWRIGYAGAAQGLIAAMTKVQSQISSGACSVAQAAAVAALNGSQDEVARFCKAFESRRNLVVERITKIPELTLDAPGGAFYAFIGCESIIGATTPDGTVINSDIDFAQYLLDHAKVAAVPGSAYGLSPFFRISTATSEEILSAAMNRICECISNLKIPMVNT
ncbi:pyridoxal phosphate-dependent aminotransferase [Agarilytica rhodophyticola]|uniref:pyridoxal phosphate-dependent aminotransferase n=1 Tax=Agarilytica rhodophyticola TaxID=1737490 RepID=UPI000B34858C|nr:pyridoxal phosphate-dependent aminotransferase [Agarilytica rhodophyticola]